MEHNGAPAPGDRPARPWLPGRRAELAALAARVRSVGPGGGALVVRGAAGSGKSALLHATRGFASRAGFLILATSGAPAGTALPYTALHELLHPLLGSAGALPDAQRVALRTAFGEEAGPAPEPFLVALAALGLLTGAAATRPVLALVDGLPWLDEPSAQVVAFLARRVGDDPVLLCAAARTEPGRRPFAAGVESLEPSGLDASAAAEVLAVTGRDLSPAERDEVIAAARGNALALTELPRMWREFMPADGGLLGPAPTPAGRLERGFAALFGALPRAARDAVLVAAVDPGATVTEILAAAARIGGSPVTTGDLDRAAAAGLLRVEENRIRFRHQLVRSGVLHAQPHTRHRAAHTALGAALGSDPYRGAWHRALGMDRPDDEAADALEATHRIALARGSSALAIRALERSAHLTRDPARRGRRLLLAAELGVRLERSDLVRPLLDAAARTAPGARDRARTALLSEPCGHGAAAHGTGGEDLCALAEDAARAADAPLALDLLLAAARSCHRADPGAPTRRRVVATAEHLKGPAWDPRLTAALALAEPVRQAADVLAQLTRAAKEHGVDSDGLRLLGTAAHAVGDPVLATDFLDRAEAGLRERGRLAALSQVLAVQTRARLDLGALRRAGEASAELRRLAAETGCPVDTAGALVAEAGAAALRGDTGAARRLADRAEKAGHGRDADLPAEVALVRGIAACAADHHDEAYDTLRALFPEAGRPAPGSPARDDHSPRPGAARPGHDAPEAGVDDPPCRACFGAIGFLADAAVQAGRHGEAARVVARLARRTAGSPAPLLRAHLRYAAAVLADDIEAETLFRRALADNLARWPWPRARAELAYGGWLRRQHRTAESRPLLRSARLTFDRIGARPWAARAGEELRAAGERTAPPATCSPLRQRALMAGELGPLESQIARLAGLGLSDREVGDRLFLSARTVGAHVGRVLHRLGLASRDGLGTALDTWAG
ncbi:LuxR family transcriptional regulator [Streptomyces sp. NPDC006632]|uniref:LuxR family transcriptional regulator n=1 Tax=Streptomyces sp. NPDC006632 TaxID=3157182 RepID=UPI0033AB6983